MDIGQAELHEIVGNIWESVLSWYIQPASPVEFSQGARGWRTGFVQIAGAWEGAVVCISSETLVRRAAAVMFDLKDEEVTIDLLQDTFGELTNMIGGNLKSLLPGPSFLCLPAVIEGSDYAVCVPSAQNIAEATFSCHDEPLVVKLLGAGPGQSGRGLARSQRSRGSAIA